MNVWIIDEMDSFFSTVDKVYAFLHFVYTSDYNTVHVRVLLWCSYTYMKCTDVGQVLVPMIQISLLSNCQFHTMSVYSSNTAVQCARHEDLPTKTPPVHTLTHSRAPPSSSTLSLTELPLLHYATPTPTPTAPAPPNSPPPLPTHL